MGAYGAILVLPVMRPDIGSFVAEPGARTGTLRESRVSLSASG